MGKGKQLLVFTVTPSKIKIKTAQLIKSRIWEVKEGKCTKTLAKIQVGEIFHMRDIRRNIFPKFMELCMEMPCCCHLTSRN